jgi:hypothetical protein
MNDDVAATSFQTHTSIRQLTEDEILAVAGGTSITATSQTVNGVSTYTLNGKTVPAGTYNSQTSPALPPGETVVLEPGLTVVSLSNLSPSPC